MKEQTIELEKAFVSLRTDRIIHVHIKGGEELELADAKEVVAAIGFLGNKKKFPVLIDCEEFSTVSKEARAYSASKETNIYTSADALAYHSLAHKLFADIYVNIDKPAIPTKIFPDNEQAITWLKTFLKDIK